tara:strand:- start:45 stop:803 length:759 start_codon:yes stop_codon:yes gene_type:complete
MEAYEEFYMKIIWSGLADEKYYEYIAKYCLPSWEKLPGEKYVIHNSNKINYKFLNMITADKTENYNSPFWDIQKSKKKTNNFWRKMQSQVWAVRNIKDCNFLVLLDTDIEVLDFNEDMFNSELEKFIASGYVWATGRSQSRLHDSGFIIFNMNHPDLHTLVNEYENIWDSGEIFNLKKSYDGNAVESMFEKWPSYKIMNTDYGKGLHIYDVGVVHYGSKMPKQMRAECTGDVKKMLDDYTGKIIVKRYKNLK